MAGPRYVELIRVSSAGQAARDTPADQGRALDALRRSRPGVLVERIEEAVSGAKGLEDRPDLRRLAELAAARAFDEVRVRHLDRLTRHADPGERSAILAMVYRAEAVIVDTGGTVLDPRTMAGELVWVVQTLGSAEERRKIAERTSAAKDRLAAQGRLVSGRAPYGRTWDKRKGWGLDRDAAAIYRRIFREVLDGRSTRLIAARLEAEGHPLPLGGRWSAAHISHLVREPTAVGRYTAHGHTSEIPAIVDAETQARALAALGGRDGAKGGRPALTPALLRRLLVCGECGAPLYTDKGGKGRTATHYYVCSSGGPCRRWHQVARVDAAVRERVERWLRSPAALTAGASREAPEDDGAAERGAAAAERELADLDRQEEKLARLMRRGLLTERVGAQQLREVAELRRGAEERLKGARAAVAAAARREDLAATLEERVRLLRKRLGSASREQWRALLEILVPRTRTTGVWIWPDGRIELRGAVPLDEGAFGKLSRNSREAQQFPEVPIRLCASAPPLPSGRPRSR